MHDGNPNSIGNLSAQEQILALASITLVGVIGVPLLYPHDTTTVLGFLGLMTTFAAQLVNLDKTQKVQTSLCETAQASNAKKEEILQAVQKDLSTTMEIRDSLKAATPIDMKP